MTETTTNAAQENRPTGSKILIIEDDSFLLGLAAKKFEKEGYNTIFASEGNAALALVEKEKPELIMLDLLLPGMDGFEVLKRIKESPALKSIPVVVFSNLGDEASVSKAKGLGADDYVVKANSTLEEVLVLVKRMIGKK